MMLLLALPERVTLKTPTQTFTATHEVVVENGKLWWRRHGQPWSLLPPDGLPAPRGRLEALKELTIDLPALPKPFRRPVRIEALSADGDNLIAIGAGGTVYYAKLSTLDWADEWGPTGLSATLSVKELDAFAMSHRKIAYEDLDGNVHPVSAGVTTLYALRGGGRTLAFADPWLPPNFERTLCLPQRGRFVASALSASASTVFVMDRSGRSFTRLVDFDIHGDNPALPYSYTREKRRGPKSAVRTLPAPDWVEQPAIPGRHTTRITILQTGPTNVHRELRVEGELGVWSKRLDAAQWKLMPGSARAAGPWAEGAPSAGPSRDVVLTARNPWPGTRISLEDWNPECEPARLRIEAGKELLDLSLPFHDGLELGGRYQGALLLPAGKSPWLHKLRVLALGRSHLEVELVVTKDEVHVLHLPLIDLRFPLRGGPVLLPIPDRKWAEGAPEEGWCGEASIQMVALHYGAWISQPVINSLGRSTHVDLWEEDVPVALRKVGLSFERAQSTSREEFIAWIIGHVRQGHPVIVGAKLFPTEHPEWDVDHLMPVVGFTDSGLVFNTNLEWGQKEVAFAALSGQEGISFAGPTGKLYGFAVLGFAEAGPALKVVEESAKSIRLEAQGAWRVRREELDGGVSTGPFNGVLQLNPGDTARIQLLPSP